MRWVRHVDRIAEVNSALKMLSSNRIERSSVEMARWKNNIGIYVQ
jgi:hypothetical protein